MNNHNLHIFSFTCVKADTRYSSNITKLKAINKRVARIINQVTTITKEKIKTSRKISEQNNDETAELSK